MDWTGGTRRRFAGAKNNNAALQRQKAHFARARAAIQHEQVSSHQRSKAIAHNDDARARPYKEGGVLRSISSPRLLTQSASGQDTVISRRDERIMTSIRQSGATSLAGNAQPHQDEELHLLASRRKLLARNDWLALDHTGPLRIRFPTAVDKDRVGRRRKIKKSSETRTKAARPQLVTPLFEERLEPNAYYISGASFPEHRDHVEVKVGTSAFGTQVRPSGRSNSSRNASIGAQSTALSHLSEESMLLGADGDSFDADQVEVPAYTRDADDALAGLVAPVSYDSTHYEDEEVYRYSSRTPQYSLALNDDPELQQYRADICNEDSTSISSPHQVAEPTIGLSKIDKFAASKSQTWKAGHLQQSDDFENLDIDVLVDQSRVAVPLNENSSELDAEQEWRHLMGVVTQSESLTSRKALRSSSEHITTSESIQMARPGDVQHGANINDDTIDPRHCISTINQAQPAQAPDSLMTGTQPPPPLPEVTEGNTDDEALWREFIIGSQDTESGDELHPAWQRSREKMRESSEQPPSVQVSGLGTSDQATRGEATVCSPTVFADRVMDIDDSLEHDIESIEESPLDDILRPISPRNIYTTRAKKLDPRRFKMFRDIEADTTRRKSQQHAASRRYSSRRLKNFQGRG